MHPFQSHASPFGKSILTLSNSPEAAFLIRGVSSTNKYETSLRSTVFGYATATCF